MGVDLLDIVYRLERAFTIKIERGDLIPDDIINNTQGKYVVDGELTTLGLEEIERRMPSANFSSFEKKPAIQNLATILTVGTLCDLVEQKVREKNKDGNFPNVSLQISNSVSETLSKHFNIADSSKIDRNLHLEQLAGLSDAPLSPDVWRQFYKICRDDPDDLKTIKVCIRSQELVSTWDAFCWSLIITIIVGVWFWNGIALGFFYFDVLSCITVLSIPGVILFGSRFVMNWKRCGRAPRTTVGEIIDYLVGQRPDRSIRADGLPYRREEIEQIVADILCEVLAVEPEKVTPKARILHDLGAE